MRGVLNAVLSGAPQTASTHGPPNIVGWALEAMSVLHLGLPELAAGQGLSEEELTKVDERPRCH